MSASPRIAVYPGSFDPLTNGHVDIVRRSARLFDRVILAILVNAAKRPMFSVDERAAMARDVFGDDRRIEVDTFGGLLTEYAARRGATVIVRGLRAVSDFEYEMQMGLMNRHLSPALETIFMMPAEQYAYVSSRLVKEVASLGGSVAGLVPSNVEARLRDRAQQSDDRP